MARPARTDSERKRGGMRAAALLHALARHVGAENPFQFATRFDARMNSTTHTSGKWRLNFAGGQALSINQLKLLSQFDARANLLHEHGPADLWIALWGDVHDLWQLCRSRLCRMGPSLDDRIWAEVAGEFGDEKAFDETLADFEGEVLLAEANQALLPLRYLSEAVALHRLFQTMSTLALLSFDGAGTYRCVRICLDNANVAAELSHHGILKSIRDELAAIVTRPEAAVPAEDRWEALRSRLDWIG